MEKSRKSKENFKSLTKLLRKWNLAYRIGKEIVSDRQFDRFEDFLRKRLPSLPSFMEEPLSSSILEHSYPMVSIRKTKDLQELYKRSLKLHKPYLEAKVDGVSFSLEKDTEGEVKLISRGNGLKGNDLKDKLRLEWIGELGEGIYRGEVFVTWSDFKKLEQNYSSPRNYVAGILNSKREEDRENKLKTVVYDLVKGDKVPKNYRLESLAFLDFEDMLEKVKILKRLGGEIPLDGVVLKDHSPYEICSGRRQRVWCWKFPTSGVLTRVEEVVWDVGRTGILTPVLILRAVYLDGQKIGKVTCHNASKLREYGLNVGSVIEITRAGQTIPFLSKILISTTAVLPEICPSCGKCLMKWERDLKCVNSLCPAKITSYLDYVMSRKVFDVKSLSSKNLAILAREHGYDTLRLISARDFKLTSVLPRFKEKSLKRLIGEIERVDISMKNCLMALNLNSLAERWAVRISDAYENDFDLFLEDLKDTGLSRVAQMKNLSRKSLDSLRGIDMENEIGRHVFKIWETFNRRWAR